MATKEKASQTRQSTIAKKVLKGRRDVKEKSAKVPPMIMKNKYTAP